MGYKIDFFGEEKRFATSVKELHNALWDMGVSCNIVKWLGYYDVAVPEHPGRLFPTWNKRLTDCTIDYWAEMILKFKQEDKITRT